MSGNQSEDEAWRSIVENYGERPGDAELSGQGRGSGDEPVIDAEPDPEPAPEPFRAYIEDPDDRFVPPAPPPLPHPPPVRLAAWLGIFGAPAVLLVALVLAFPLPTIVGYALIAWFVGGFAYLVLTMDTGPRDPGDNGARL